MAVDLLIRGGTIIDGTGNPWIYGDLVVNGDRIEAVLPDGSVDESNAGEVVEASGMIVCPGFIDIQSHSIMPLMRDGRCLSKITQGVTTEIMGEAWTPAPFGGKIDNPMSGLLMMDLPEWEERAFGWTRFRHWLEAMVAQGVSPNIGSFLGGGTLRRYGKGMAMGPAGADELDVMRRVMSEALEDGAFGVAYALIYPPDAFVGADEIVEVCKVVAEHQGVYITHVRSEADGLIEGIEEALEIGRRSGASVEIYHLKAAGRANWHKMPRVVEMIESARAEGLDVTADMYPYTANGTGLSSVLPPWAEADGKLYENLADPEMRARIKQEALNPGGAWEALATWAGPEGVMPVGFERPENRRFAGMRLTEIQEERGDPDWVETVFELLLSERQRISTIYFSLSEDNVASQLRLPWIKVSSDAGGLDPAWAAADGPTHPRAYGTFTRVLGKYVREEGVLTWEDAIRKMTSSVATRLGLRDRGSLRAGAYADIVIFDPATVTDHATFEDSHRLSTGVRDVWVNGARVVSGGVHTGATPGRIVGGPGRAG
jgi:N-acyl-D-aspartate/D-glutamate deacylase